MSIVLPPPEVLASLEPKDPTWTWHDRVRGDDFFPLRDGMIVTIPKGTPVWRKTHPSQRGVRRAGRTYKVKIQSIMDGHAFCMHRCFLERVEGIGGFQTLVRPDRCVDEDHEFYTFNPRIVWAGSGGYWCEADVNFIPETQLVGSSS